MKRNSWIRWTSTVLILSFPAAANHHLPGEKPDGTRGPGPGNFSYENNELWKPMGYIETKHGHGTMVMHRGYLVVIYAPDSGRKGGGLSFWDISNPRKPKIVFDRMDGKTKPMRESHAWGIWQKDKRFYAAVQTVDGIMIWDWTDISKPEIINHVKLNGVKESDYDWGAWWMAVQGDIIYVAGSNNGFYVVDAGDVKNAKVLNHVPVKEAGGFRLNCIFAVGNLLVTSNANDNSKGFATYDISDPANPELLDVLSMQVGYSSLLNGNRIYGIDEKLGVYDISDPTEIRHLGQSDKMDGKGGYAMFQDGHVFLGASKHAAQVDVSGDENFKIIGKGSSEKKDRDEDFCSVIGNFVIAGNDHGGGSAIMPHHNEPDKLGPKVNMIYPKDGAVNQALTTRVGVTFTDNVNLETLNAGTFIIRKAGAGGRGIAGVYSVQSAIGNFRPDEPLELNTTYEVIISQGGIEDYNANGLEESFFARFSTGNEITEQTAGIHFGEAAGPNETLKMKWMFINGRPVIGYKRYYGVDLMGRVEGAIQ